MVPLIVNMTLTCNLSSLDQKIVLFRSEVNLQNSQYYVDDYAHSIYRKNAEHYGTYFYYHNCPKSGNMFSNAAMCPKDAPGMENSVDSDQSAPYQQSDLGLHCLLKHVCPNT